MTQRTTTLLTKTSQENPGQSQFGQARPFQPKRVVAGSLPLKPGQAMPRQNAPIQANPGQSNNGATNPGPTISSQTIPGQTDSSLPIPFLNLPDLQQLVTEASRALAHLDLKRLEELALSCEALNRDLQTCSPRLSPHQKRELADRAKRASADMAVFARVLDATRSNLKVMERLDQLRAERLEYRVEFKNDAVAPHPEILKKGSVRGLD